MTPSSPLLLALDAGSPVVSVAVGWGGEATAQRSVELAHSSARLLQLVDEALAEAGAARGDLAGVVALQGPGSFTGLRVGLATALGLHQALELPAAGVPTLRVLAATLPQATGDVVAAVDAIRGEWFVQTFAPGRAPSARGETRRVPTSHLARLGAGTVVGFGAAAALAAAGVEAAGVEVVEPPPLAVAALALAHDDPPAWDAESLTRPLYLRPPAATPSAARVTKGGSP